MIHDLSTKEVQKPNIEDFDLQPYGYIHALQTYVEFLEAKILEKEIKKENNIYLNRLKEQYIKAKEEWNGRLILKNCYEYDAMRLFCLDTQLISFNDIELMESEINSSF